MGNRRDALEMVHQMRCGGKKYPDGGKFFHTNLQNESPLMYQPMMPISYSIETPYRFRPQPDLGDYQAPASTGMVVDYPINLPSRTPVVVQDGISAPVVVEAPVENLFSDKMVARRALKQRYAESAFNDKAKSGAGAQGAWQIMPITLKDYLGRGRGRAGDLNDPEYNRKVRDWVMGIIPRDLKEFWSEDDSDRAKLAKLYAAYNWGAGNLRGFLREKRDAGIDISNPDNWVDDLNPETRRYVKYLAFDEDIPDSTVYTNAAFEKAAAERGYASGGRIHIKPENRGKFTALKKRTGHSASWFKTHGTPAQKKMAVFALNSRHWGNRKDAGGENLIAEYPEGYNGELRQGKSFNAWDRYLANHPMAGHRLRKAKTLLLDAARVHPLTSFATDVYDSYAGPQDESDKITTPLGVVGRGGDIILNTVKQAGEIEPNMKKVFGRSAFGWLVSLPDFIDDSLKFVRDFAEPVTSFENGGPLANFLYSGGPYGVIPLGGDYLTYLQTMPEVPGGVIEPSVVTAALPAKFNGSQEAARRYAEGYQKGAKPVSEAMNRAGQDIFNTVDTVVGLTPTPAGAITWLGHMGADAAEGEWGKVGRDVALATALGAGARGIGWLRNYIDDATNFGEDIFRAFTDGVPGRVSTNFVYDTPKPASFEPGFWSNKALGLMAEQGNAEAAAELATRPYEIENLGGGYMLKSLMRGNPLEKQISKNGTVNVNNVRALVGKGSKVEQAVVDKVLASEEFAGKKSIDYNKFRKAVQDELITYDRTPNTKWSDYGLDRIGLSFGNKTDVRNAEDRMNMLRERIATGRFSNGEKLTESDIADAKSQLEEMEAFWRQIPEAETYTFSSSRIPNGSAKHYDANTLGHSRTYTTADESDVLHVMESQSDWAQEGLKPQNHFFNSNGEDITDIVKRSWTAERKTPVERMYDYDSRIYVFGDTPEERAEFDKLTEEYNKLNERIQASSDFNPDDFYKQRELKEKLDKIATVPYEGTGRSRGRLGVSKKTPHLRPGLEERIVSPGTQETYLANNYTSRQIQENLRYAAEKGQTKMRYPTRETAAKIEGYPEREAYFDASGRDITADGPVYTYGDDVDKRIADINKRIDQLESNPGGDAEMNEYTSLIGERMRLLQGEAKLKPGVTKKTVYDYEDILRKYTEFPKQYKKLYKNADVRIVTDPKGNTWYEVDVPENYLQQEWAYEEGGSMILPKMMMDKHSPDKLRKAIASIKAKRMQ